VSAVAGGPTAAAPDDGIRKAATRMAVPAVAGEPPGVSRTEVIWGIGGLKHCQHRSPQIDVGVRSSNGPPLQRELI
jgi:hypothetical protein